MSGAKRKGPEPEPLHGYVPRERNVAKELAQRYLREAEERGDFRAAAKWRLCIEDADAYLR